MDYMDDTDSRKRAAGIFRSRLRWTAINFDYFLSAKLKAEAPVWDAAVVWA